MVAMGHAAFSMTTMTSAETTVLNRWAMIKVVRSTMKSSMALWILDSLSASI